MTEDDILDRFECWELREKIAELEGKLALAHVRSPAASKELSAARAAADRYMKLYETTLARNVILNRKVKELGG